MSRKKYPLEALRGLRHTRVSEQAVYLSERSRGTERARSGHGATEKARRAEQQRMHSTLAAERSLLEKGELSAADLARADAYRRASNARAEQLSARERRALAELHDAAQKEAEVRAELARRDAQAKLMDRHREDWQDADTRDRERAEEEANLEQWTPKRDSRKRV